MIEKRARLRISNCWFYAVHRWVTCGGYLILRRSWAGPYPHMMHADTLPEDLAVTHFTNETKNPVWWRWVFGGYVYFTVGHTKSPPVKGLVDWALLSFCVPWLIGVSLLLTWIIKLIIGLII